MGLRHLALIDTTGASPAALPINTEWHDMKITVFGSGCSKCRSTVAMLERVAKNLGVVIELTKIENTQEIHSLGVEVTPAVMVDGQLVHCGGVPSHEKVQG